MPDRDIAYGFTGYRQRYFWGVRKPDVKGSDGVFGSFGFYVLMLVRDKSDLICYCSIAFHNRSDMKCGRPGDCA